MAALRFEGRVSHLREVLKKLKSEAPCAGTLAGDQINRRRYSKMLRKATAESLRQQIIGGGAS